MVTVKPRLTLRQLVRRSHGNVVYAGRVHIVQVGGTRALCNRTLDQHGRWFPEGHPRVSPWEYPVKPVADCVKCLDELMRVTALARGQDVMVEKITTTIFVRHVAPREGVSA